MPATSVYVMAPDGSMQVPISERLALVVQPVLSFFRWAIYDDETGLLWESEYPVEHVTSAVELGFDELTRTTPDEREDLLNTYWPAVLAAREHFLVHGPRCVKCSSDRCLVVVEDHPGLEPGEWMCWSCFELHSPGY